jgi:hypothetical protein
VLKLRPTRAWSKASSRVPIAKGVIKDNTAEYPPLDGHWILWNHLEHELEIPFPRRRHCYMLSI